MMGVPAADRKDPHVYVLIDLTIGKAELAEPEDTKRFHVAVAHGLDQERAAAVLAESGAGRLDADDPDHAWIATAWVEAAAEGRVRPGWSERFDAMVEHATGQGWVEEGTGSIRAHVEWIPSDSASIESGPPD